MCNSEITNGTRGAFDWNTWRNGNITDAVEAKKASFAGVSRSCTADLTVANELEVGICCLGFFNVSVMYFVM